MSQSFGSFILLNQFLQKRQFYQDVAFIIYTKTYLFSLFLDD